MKPPLYRRLVCSAGLLFLATQLSGDILDHWTKRCATNVTRVRFCGGVFVAVGPAGTILTSSNGVSWARQTSGTSRDLHGATYSSSLGFVVVGNETILISTNLVSWSNLQVAAGCELRDVTSSGGGAIVAVGGPPWGASGPSVMYYPKTVYNGPSPSNTWGRITVTYPPDPFFPDDTNAHFSAVTYAGTRFVGVGDILTGIWTGYANDIVPWTRRALPTEYCEGVAYGNSRVLVVGTEGPPYYSLDTGSTWTYSLVNTNLPPWFNDSGSDVIFGDGRFVSSLVFVTTNATNWAVGNPPGLAVYNTTIAYGAGTFIVGGYYGIWQSDNIAGIVMARPASPQGPPEISIANDLSRACAVEFSTNLLQWTEIWRGTNTGAGTTSFIDWNATNETKRFYRAVAR